MELKKYIFRVGQRMSCQKALLLPSVARIREWWRSFKRSEISLKTKANYPSKIHGKPSGE